MASIGAISFSDFGGSISGTDVVLYVDDDNHIQRASSTTSEGRNFLKRHFRRGMDASELEAQDHTIECEMRDYDE